MKDAIAKAQSLVEALPYIRAFRDKVFVIKLGGAAMEDPSTMDCVLDDVVFLEAVGVRPVLVHGGGPAISRRMKEQAIEPKFIHGHRMTDEATLGIVRDVLVNEINAEICRRLNDMKANPFPVTDPAGGAIRARRRVIEERGSDGSVTSYDLGLVGDHIRIDAPVFWEALINRQLPVVAPLALGPSDEVLNCNADMAASAVAGGLEAEKIVFLTDTHGIWRDPDDPESFVGSLSVAQVDDFIGHGIISGGMLPKVEGCRRALDAGVNKAHIIDGRLRHAILLEIFTDEGIGTQITH